MNDAIANEICWLMLHERVGLGKQLHELPRCIGFINRMLVEMYKLWKNSKH
jgi:hypothetical protein